MSGICKGTVWGTEMEKSPVLTEYAEYFAWYLSRFPLHFVLYRENLNYILDSVRNAMFTLSILCNILREY